MTNLQQKEKDFVNWKQKVWDDWWENNGHCEDCPIRCKNHGAYPSFGGLNTDADVMIVGREPGASSRFVAEGVKGKPREYRTVPENKVRKPPREYKKYPYDQKILAEWSFYWEGPSKLFGLGPNDSNNVKREIVDRTPRETYYTNALKCSRLPHDKENIEDKDVSNPSDLNKAAREQCRSYLKEEIDLVSPEVVVTFGKKAFTHAMDVLEREYSGGSLKSIMNNSDNKELICRYGTGPVIIPAYHWTGQWFLTNMGRNVDAVPENANEKECWEVIAKTVNSVLED